MRRPFGVSQGLCRARALQTFFGYGFPVAGRAASLHASTLFRHRASVDACFPGGAALRVSSSPAFRVPPQGLRVCPPDGRFAPEPHVEDTNRQSGGTCSDSRCLAQSATVDGPPARALRHRASAGPVRRQLAAVGVVAAIPGGPPRPRDPTTRERTLWHSVYDSVPLGPQPGIAGYIGVYRRAAGDGESYPKNASKKGGVLAREAARDGTTPRTTTAPAAVGWSGERERTSWFVGCEGQFVRPRRGEGRQRCRSLVCGNEAW